MGWDHYTHNIRLAIIKYTKTICKLSEITNKLCTVRKYKEILGENYRLGTNSNSIARKQDQCHN